MPPSCRACSHRRNDCGTRKAVPDSGAARATWRLMNCRHDKTFTAGVGGRLVSRFRAWHRAAGCFCGRSGSGASVGTAGGVHTRCRFLIHAYRMEARRMRAHGVDPQRTEALQETVAIGTREFVAGVKRQLLGRDLSGVGGKRELRRRVALETVRKAVEQIKGGRRAALRTGGGGGRPRKLGGAQTDQPPGAGGGHGWCAAGDAAEACHHIQCRALTPMHPAR